MAETNPERADGQERRMKPRYTNLVPWDGHKKAGEVPPEWMRQDSDYMRIELEKIEQEIWIRIAVWLVLGYVGYVLYDSVRGYLP